MQGRVSEEQKTRVETGWDKPAVIMSAYVFLVLLMAGISGHLYLKELRHRAGLDAARVYADVIDIVHDYYSAELVPRLQGAGIHFDPAYEKTETDFPFPGRLVTDINAIISARHDGHTLRLFSNHPFPWRSGRKLSADEQTTLKRIVEDRQGTLISYQNVGGQTLVHLAEAVEMKPSCIGCHNSVDYGLAKTWKVGDVRGVRAVTVPVPQSISLQPETYAFGLAYLLLSVGLGVAIMRRLYRRVGDAYAESQALTQELEFRNQRLAAESLNKTNFLANMSHELRTPLNAIIGYAQIHDGKVLGESGAGTYHSNNRHILSAASHLRELIEDVLDLARIESGRVELNEAVCRVQETLGDVKTLTAATVEAGGFQYAEDIEVDVPDLKADARALRQMLVNLVTNALAHSGGRRITLRASSCADGLCAGGVCLSVADDGKGIPPEQLDRLTQRFYSNALTRRQGVGSGIGLWLVDALIQAHGGHLRIESAPGTGSCFTLVFPANRTVDVESSRSDA